MSKKNIHKSSALVETKPGDVVDVYMSRQYLGETITVRCVIPIGDKKHER
jgi:hypothetical protein